MAGRVHWTVMDLRPARPEDYEAFARLFVVLGTGDSAPSSRGWVETMTGKEALSVARAGRLEGAP